MGDLVLKGKTAALDCQRVQFRLPSDICYLNTAFMSPLLNSVNEAAQAGLQHRGRPWTITEDDFFEPAESIRRLFAGLIHADADGVFLAPSISYVMATAARNLPCPAGSNIVVVTEQFPSNVYPWRVLAQQQGAEVRTVEFTTDDWTESILANIDKQTSVVTIPHVHWTTGVAFDLVRIGACARDVGAALIIDATQSLGTLPLDVREVQPDVLAATGYKSLLGPYGLTYAHLAPRWRSGVPLEEAWLNRANARTFSQLTEYCDDYMPGARRYEMGERANSLLLPMAIAALQQIAEWGVERIEGYTRPLIQSIVNEADERNLWHPPAEQCSPCMVGIRLPGDSPDDLGSRLARQGIFVSVRKTNARIAPHVFNTEADIERCFAVLDELVS